MPQRDALLPWLSAIDNAALALRVAGVARRDARARAHDHFAAFGLEGFEHARPATLSGGMRQRVAFLRTLLAGRPVLCLDEPFGALDALTRLQMQRWLGDALERDPRTVLLVTHDVEEAVLLADRVVLLSPRPGRVVEVLDVGAAAAAGARRPCRGRAARARADGARRGRGAVAGGCALVTAALVLVALVAGWEAVVRVGGVDPLILPPPSDVLQALWEDRSLLAPDLWTTTYEVLLGLAAATVAGAALGVAMHLSPALRRALRPLVIGSQAVPVPVIAPLVILVLGFGLLPKVLLVALVCFFPITINLYDGLRARRSRRQAPAALAPGDPLAVAAAGRGAGRAALGVHRAEDRRGRRRDRRRVRGVGRRRERAGARADHRQRPARDRPRVRRHAPALPAGHRPLRRLRAARAAGGRLDPTLRLRRTMTRRLLPIPLLLCALAFTACGEKEESGGAGKVESLRVMLDYFPNADHAGIYAAQESGAYSKAGLDVEITPPPDPSAPLKLLLAGKTDLAISYPPELLLARDKGAQLVAVGALVQKPLTSLMAVGKAKVRSPADLRGKRVGTAGIPYQSAYLKTILQTAGVDPGSVKETNVGFNLVPAMLSGKVDATLGAFWNYEGVDLARRGKDPVIQHMEKLGVPTYPELVFVARRRDLDQDFGAKVRRFMQATARGHETLRKDPQVGIDGLLAADSGLDRDLQQAAVRATLPVFFPDDDQRPFGYQDQPEWQDYADWMFEQKLLTRQPDAEQVMTNEFLAGEGLDPRGALEQD